MIGDHGLPCAGHRWFQVVQRGPLQDTAEPTSQAGAASVKTYLRKCKKCYAAAVINEEGGREVLHVLDLGFIFSQ